MRLGVEMPIATVKLFVYLPFRHSMKVYWQQDFPYYHLDKKDVYLDIIKDIP